MFKFVINFTHGFRLGLIDVTDYLHQIYREDFSTIAPARRCAEQVVASPARQFASVGSLTSKRVVYLPWSTFPANLKISMIPARRNGRRGKPLMVIVTRGRCRIDTLCQMLCRFLAQITQQQRHRLRASQTAGIAKCPQRNSSRTIKQRPGNDQALYAPARQRVKICSL